jgi:uncharacterized protein YecA (UPF0149 family)
MDVRDGSIYEAAEVDRLLEADRQYLRPMAYDPTPTRRAHRRVGRNDPCPCGSGRKFKRCCLWRSTAAPARP